MAQMLGKVRWTDGCKHRCCTYPQHKSKSRRLEDQQWREEHIHSDEFLGLPVVEPHGDQWKDYLDNGNVVSTPEPVSTSLLEVLHEQEQAHVFLEIVYNLSRDPRKVLFLDLQELTTS